ncbi:MAG: T9SS type A sorting domain-containing protein [Leptolyngbya sp. SIO3F4]|nr:T9SS type A sorting domain-containing protein [Leptolyngbya sp. SIO3F4]
MASMMSLPAGAQERYLEEIFTDAEITVDKDVVYGVNVDFLKNQNLFDPTYLATNQAQIVSERTQLIDSIENGGSIPTAFFDPADGTTVLKVSGGTSNPAANPFGVLLMDVYYPSAAADNLAERPVIIYIHTGNFLPPIINGGTGGSKEDSVAVELCRQWAKRGYVAIAPNYRHGWDPLSGSQQIRRATLLNAVYRAIHDVKQSVRVMRGMYAQGNPYGIDPSNIAVYGQGSGGYVALAYNTLDDIQETQIQKFIDPTTNQSYIDENIVGGVDGTGGLLNLYTNPFSLSTEIHACAHAGGALGSMAWVDGNEVPTISFHCVNDPFAPFDTGIVIVPTTNGPVVPVPGANMFIPEMVNLGINDSFKDLPGFEDPYTVAARSRYGQTYDFYLNPPGSMTVSAGAEGLFSFVFPANQGSQFENQGSPWEWWSLTGVQDRVAYTQVVTGDTYDANAIHQGALLSNPDMSKSKALIYVDTIQGYLQPRLMRAMEIGNWQALSTEEVAGLSDQVKVYPNPSQSQVFVTATGTLTIQSLSLYDVTGKAVIENREIAAPQYDFSVSGLPSGMYFLKLQTDEGEVNQRLMVE